VNRKLLRLTDASGAEFLAEGWPSECAPDCPRRGTSVPLLDGPSVGPVR